MIIRRAIIIALLLLLGIQSAIAGADMHDESDSHDQSSLTDISVAGLAETTDDFDNVDTSHTEAGCDHCGNCCNCHSNANAVQAIPSLTVSTSPSAIPSFKHGIVSQVTKSLYRPPIA